jgi:ABC-type Mn2+/Zn2+ transport system permease subunit
MTTATQAGFFLLDPLQSSIGRYALAEVILLGALSGALGFWVVSYGLSYGAESLAHGLLPGLVAAALIGAPLLAGAFAGAALTAVLVALAARDDRVGPETATAVAVTGMLGLGVLMALAPATPQRLAELLFGNPLSADGSDVLAALVLALLGGGALVALERPLAAVAFDPAGARSLGVRPNATRVALAVLLAAAVCVAAQGLGNLLALAAIVAPPIAVRRHVTSVGAALRAGAAVGALAGVVGIYASYELDLAAGAAVALALTAAAAIGALAPPAAGAAIRKRPGPPAAPATRARATLRPPGSSPR